MSITKLVTAMVTVMMTLACGALQHVIWPQVASCAGTVTGPLVDVVDQLVTQGPADWDKSLEALAAQYTPELMVCVLRQLLPPAHVSNARAVIMFPSPRVERIEGFLSSHGQP
jgi:hypothetical protein